MNGKATIEVFFQRDFLWRRKIFLKMGWMDTFEIWKKRFEFAIRPYINTIADSMKRLKILINDQIKDGIYGDARM